MLFRIIIWIVFILGGIAAGFYIDTLYFPLYLTSWIWHILSFILGVFCIKLVLTISRNTGKTLAKYGREGNIARLQTNKLVTKGVYSCMRHPMHLGLFLFPLSFALLVGSISFIIIIVPFEILLMIIMIFTIEEPEAIKKFGQDYKDYRDKVPAFNLSYSCLKKLFNNS